jgi:hypothetical protein
MFNKDAFSNGQVDSKLWLCQELEKLEWSSDLTHIYAGWHGILSFLLLSRENFEVGRIESFDLDPTCEPMADMINENWVIKEWKFKAFTLDCNQGVRGTPDLIINTSTEHFDSMEWFDRIRPGTRVILQGNNMPHDDHFIDSASLEDFIAHYPLSKIVYQGSLDFIYPKWSFTRYMIIGIK